MAVIPFDDTYILYDPEDPLAYLSVYFTLLPVLILAFYLSWFIVTRELEPCFIAFGQVCNEVFNNVVKNHIREPRPGSLFRDAQLASFQQGTVRSGYGMPSAHAQFMGFCTAYFALQIWLRWTGNPPFERAAILLLIMLLAVGVCASRVYLQYHSARQVWLGYQLGAYVGTIYYLAVQTTRALQIPTLILHYAPRWLYLRDTWIDPSATLKQWRKEKIL